MKRGLYQEGVTELDAINLYGRGCTEVLALRLAIYLATKRWKLLYATAERLVQEQPFDFRWLAALAYAARRAHSAGAARAILSASRVKLLPDTYFHSALYDCESGDFKAAKQDLEFAVERQITDWIIPVEESDDEEVEF